MLRRLYEERLVQDHDNARASAGHWNYCINDAEDLVVIDTKNRDRSRN